jgi:hypothetical protein
MTNSDDSLEAMLSRMRAEPLPVRSEDDEKAREIRMAALIDDCVARLPVPEVARPARRGWVMVLLAASLSVFGIVVALELRKSSEVSSIESEPPSARSKGVARNAASADAERNMPAPAGKDETTVRVPKRVPRSSTSQSPTSAEPQRPTTGPKEPTPANQKPNGEAAEVGSTSTLSEENRLFQAAAQAEQGGDINAALTSLDKLVQDYPRSPLAQNALARKFRLLSRVGRKNEAMEEARRYLRAYPSGFAEREAATILSTPAAPAAGPSTWPDAGDSGQ